MLPVESITMTTLRTACVVPVLLLLVLADMPTAAEDTKGQWVEISFDVEKKKANVTGMVVDRTTGDIYTIANHGAPHQGGGKGVWKSTDRGDTFARVDDGKVSGGGWNPHCIDIDPAGQRLGVFPMYGTAAITLDGGKTWRPCDRHFDWASVDWTDPEAKTILGTFHETKPGMRLSHDGGKTWQPLDFSYREALGLFDAKTLVVGRANGIHRSTDDGKTWTKVADVLPTSRALKVLKGTGYFLSEKGLLVSKDKGLTWAVQGTAIPDKTAWVGPYFGKDEKHIFVVGRDGVQETTDGGQTWKVVTPLPKPIAEKEFKRNWGNGPCLGYDPNRDTFYISFPGSPMFRYQR